MRKQAGKRPERKPPARLITKAHLLERTERQGAFDAAERAGKRVKNKAGRT